MELAQAYTLIDVHFYVLFDLWHPTAVVEARSRFSESAQIGSHILERSPVRACLLAE